MDFVVDRAIDFKKDLGKIFKCSNGKLKANVYM